VALTLPASVHNPTLQHAWLLMLSSVNFLGIHKMHRTTSTGRAGQRI